MSKSILILETPDRCSECILYSDNGRRRCHGQFMCLIEHYEELDDYKQNHCPLFSMPEKSNDAHKLDEYEDGWDDGWNSCISYLESAGKSRVLEIENGNETGVS